MDSDRSIRTVELFRSWRGVDSELARSMLESAGIRCFVQGSGDARIADNRLLVHEDDEEEARALLAAMNAGDFELSEGEDPEG